MSSTLRISALLLAVLMLLGGCRAMTGRSAEPVSGVEFAMNTWVEQRWYGDEAQETYDDIMACLRDLEARLSLYREDSEISALNASAGREPVRVSRDTFTLLSRAKEFSAESGGLFDVTIAPLTLTWGITSGEPHIPGEGEIAAAQALVDYRGLILDREAQTAMLAREGMKVDLGGIAKGMAASVCAEIPRKHGVSGYLSIGGNTMVCGKKPDGQDFLVGLRDPRGEASEALGSFAMDGLTMATTGDYERYFEQDGVRYHHVLDPFTGRPSASDLISVTVISADGTLADCLSTSIFLRGSGALEQYFARDDCRVIAVTKDLQVYATPGLWDDFTINPSKTQYTFHKS